MTYEQEEDTLPVYQARGGQSIRIHEERECALCSRERPSVGVLLISVFHGTEMI